MERQEWNQINRAERAWPAGEWDNEPDKIQWQDPATKLPCLIVRNRFGSLCGYVGVSPGHVFYGKRESGCLHVPPCDPREEIGCDHSLGAQLLVHGGVTFTDGCQEARGESPEESDEAGRVCHVPAPGEPGDVWWIGFATANLDDLAPVMLAHGFRLLSPRSKYRNVAYVEREVALLAAQIAKKATT